MGGHDGNLLLLQTPDQGGHYGVLALAGLVLAQLLLEVGGMLPGQLGEGRRRRRAALAVTGQTRRDTGRRRSLRPHRSRDPQQPHAHPHERPQCPHGDASFGQRHDAPGKELTLTTPKKTNTSAFARMISTRFGETSPKLVARF